MQSNVVNKVRYTHHFHARLLDRFGIVLTADERVELAETIRVTVDAMPWVAAEESVEIDCKWPDGRFFCAVYVPDKRLMVTAITSGRTGHHKFKKKVAPGLRPYHAETRKEYVARRRKEKYALVRKGIKSSRPRVANLPAIDMGADERDVATA